MNSHSIFVNFDNSQVCDCIGTTLSNYLGSKDKTELQYVTQLYRINTENVEVFEEGEREEVKVTGMTVHPAVTSVGHSKMFLSIHSFYQIWYQIWVRNLISILRKLLWRLQAYFLFSHRPDIEREILRVSNGDSGWVCLNMTFCWWV